MSIDPTNYNISLYEWVVGVMFSTERVRILELTWLKKFFGLFWQQVPFFAHFWGTLDTCPLFFCMSSTTRTLSMFLYI